MSKTRKSAERTCVKCGQDDQAQIEMWYCDQDAELCALLRKKGEQAGIGNDPDHIHLKCRTCGYEWLIRCEDARGRR